VAELTSPTTLNSSKWVLFVDGATNLKDSGAGVILEGLEDMLIKKSLRFSFKKVIIKLSKKH